MKNYHLLLDTCKAIAAYLHRDDYDKQQRPYIDHCIRVSTRVPAHLFYARAAAYLHDAVEDHRVTIDTLRALGLPERVLALIDILTRKEDETYFEYIDRVKEDPEALEVKLADLADNQDPLRGPIPESLRERYQKAERKLLDVKRAREAS